jgi:hypothetical protein
MKMRTFLFLLSLLFVSTTLAHDESNSNAGAVRNKDGSIVTGILAPIFDPLAGNLPFPHNLFFTGTADLTLNIPYAPGDPRGALFDTLNSLDGFSTTEKWTISFKDRFGNPGSIDPSSVVPGHSVRVFQITTSQIVIPTGLVRELVAGVDYVAAAITPSVVGIIWLKPLPEYSSFLAVLTNDIKDTSGNDATPDTFYHLAKAHTPWIDANFQSTYPLLNDASAQALEGLRQLTNAQEFVAAAAGINHEDIILSYTVQTQSISPSLRLLRSIAQPAQVLAGPTGLNTSALGGPGLADIIAGVITLPYYLGMQSAENPLAPLNTPWQAPPGGYVPPFDQAGFDPTSRHITAINPFPALTSMQTVPIIITVPNANSGFTKPENGWPVVIYQHGLTRNRTDALLLADSMASVGMAIVSIDQPLHGVVPAEAPSLAPFYIENHPVFASMANERTFDLDFLNNTTGFPGPDGVTDGSGDIALATILLNPLVTRDIGRQTAADLSVLAVSLQNISVDGDAIPDLDASNVGALFHSLGTSSGIPFLAIEPIVSRAYLGAATGALFRLGLAGDFGPQLKAGLASAGVIEGTAEYETAVTVIQTALDAGDSINYAAEAASKMPIIHNQVIGDRTVPNVVPGAPLSGNEAINRIMGLQSYSTTQVDPDGLHGVARFLPPAFHESLFLPVNDAPPFEVAPEVTIEMQTQAASFLVSGGTLVQVNNPDLLETVMSFSEMFNVNPASRSAGKKKPGPALPVGPRRVTSGPLNIREGMNND